MISFDFNFIDFRYVLGAVETFLDAVPAAGFFQGYKIINLSLMAS
jgi:hypothetical protein